jgi:MoaA/NifB/PqqE/SkfB family radical SAM enzyme
LSWLGGEPLLWSSIYQISQQLKSELGISTGVTTNGIRLVEKAHLEKATQAFDEITFSVDGHDHHHDRSRGTPGLYGDLLNSVRTLRSLSAETRRSIIIRVNLLLSRSSMGQLSDVLYDLAKCGVHEVTYNPLWADPNGDLGDELLRAEDVDLLVRTLRGLAPDMRRRGLSIKGNATYLNRIRLKAKGVKIPVVDCDPGTGVLFVNPHGVLAPCAYTYNQYGVSVDLLDEPSKIDRLPFVFTAMRSRSLAPRCMDCPDTNIFGKYETYSDSRETIAGLIPGWEPDAVPPGP